MKFKKVPAFEDHERFLSKISVDKNTECWLWIGKIADDRAMGSFRISPKTYSPARVSFSIFKGEMEDESNVIRKFCENEKCVNPDHMIEQSRAEWMVASRNSNIYERVNRICCPRGHEFNSTNTYQPPGKKGRECLICKKEYMKEYRKRNLERLRALDRERSKKRRK